MSGVGSSFKTYLWKFFPKPENFCRDLKIAYPPLFVASAFRKGLKGHNSDFKILNGNDFLYIVFKFGDIRYNMGWHCNFWGDSQKLAFPAKYLRKYWTDFHQIFRFGRPMSADDKSYICFVVFQGAVLW